MRSGARPEEDAHAPLAQAAPKLPRAAYRPMPFVDHFAGAVGPYLSCLNEAGRPVIGLRIDDFHISPRGYCHGGVIAALADLQSIPGSWLASVHDRFAATVSFTLDFVAPARHGDWIELRTDLVKATRQLLFTQALIVDAHDRPLARSSAVFKFDSRPHEDPRIVARLLGQ